MSREESTVSIAVDTDDASEWSVSPLLFGKFQEHLDSAIYPGVYEDYLRNGSFEVWNASGGGPMAGIVFDDIAEHDGIAYPWQPTGDGATYEQVTGGIHGRHRDDALDGGPEVPEECYPVPQEVTEPRFQRLSFENSDEGGVFQRVALPDERARMFNVTVTVRSEGIDECTVALTAPDGDALVSAMVPVTGSWECVEVELELDAAIDERYAEPQYGTYDLTITADGPGHLDLDWSTLIPGDAVEGIYNPATINLLRDFDVTTIRWPGGNYASQVHWRDTIGPVEERPVVPIVNWGGLEPNYLGTNEWLRFCELADVEPYITVPFWSATGPEEAADWVEYINGDPEESKLGALRAEHGYEEPWDVTYWGVGNEVWGHWQVGNTDAATYAEGYVEYRDAMREVDPDIEVDASAIDPWFTSVYDGASADSHESEPPIWNEVLFEKAGDAIEGIDLHRYTAGIKGNNTEARETWCEEHSEDPIGYNEILVNFPQVYDRLLSDVEDLAVENGSPNCRLTIGEWNLGPAVNEDWPAAQTGTMAHAAYAAKTFQTFIRHGEYVQMGHWTDYTLYPHPDPHGPAPPHPGAYIQREMAEPLLESDAKWAVADTNVESPDRPFLQTGNWSLPADNIALVDAVTIVSDDGTTHTFATNGSLCETYETSVEFDDGGGSTEVTLYRPVDDDPFLVQESRNKPDAFEIETFTLEDGYVELPPASFMKLTRQI
ncbi:hypothetical protein [Saliphagus infecundisoli]|uniref:Alpha-L-arabinofuranosidase 1 catalytic domain-containing protein n=1 Tax=Saliphagus infecundisoli TaxID=1849069 RepID=A0ABD5Q9U0_9EURY|nr:hypothetical protein [Saliphagus infecundisoli]